MKGIKIMKDVLKYTYDKNGDREVFPAHPFVKSWFFTADEEDEATLAQAMAVVAEKNKISKNQLQHLFPAVLRMLHSDITWSK